MNLNDLPSLEEDDYKPLYAKLGDAIESYIKDKDLQPGDPLPSESNLMHHYSVSRMTVRIAIQRLATEGLIKKIQGKGTFIAEPKVSDNIRGDMQILEQSLLDQGIKVVNVPLESTTVIPTPGRLKELNLPQGTQTIKIRRLKKVGGKNLGYEVKNLPLDVAALFSPSDLNEKPLVELLNSNPETEVHRVVYRMRSSVILEREAEILEVPVGTPILTQFATYFNRAGRPVMAGRITFPGERVDMQFEFGKESDNHRKVMVK